MLPFFPYSNFHRLNADWILSKVKELATTVGQVAEEVASWADRVTQAETDAAAALADAENAVRYTSQNLNTGERRVACTNIHAVNYDSTPLQTADAAQARQNIGAADATGLSALGSRVSDAEDRIGGLEDSRVSYSAPQSLTDAQKTQARTNIGAVGSADLPDVSDVVRTSAQSLTTAQKTQARTNIGAADAATLTMVVDDMTLFGVLNVEVTEATQGVYSFTPAYDDIVAKLSHGAPVIINYKPYGSTFVYRGLAYHSGAFSDPTDNPAIFADLLAPNDPASIANSTGYRVYIYYANNAASIIVSGYEYRYAPPASALDAGKALIVGNNGVPTWEASGPLILEFATTNPYTVTTPIADILAAIKAGRQVFFNGVYTVGNNGTGYLPLSVYGTYGTAGRLIYAEFGGDSVGQAVIFDESGGGWTTYEI